MALLEYEHGARGALLALLKSGELRFEIVEEAGREEFLRTTAPAYATQSLRQAKEFFRHAETSSWLVKPLLLYYGMLSVVKACMTFVTPDFFQTDGSRRHGLNRVKGGDDSDLRNAEINVQDVGVFQAARNAIDGAPIPGNTKIRMDDLLQRLPEITVAYHLLAGEAAGQFVRITAPWVSRLSNAEPFRVVFDLPKKFVEEKKDLLPASLTEQFQSFVPEGEPDTVRHVSKAGWDTETVARFYIDRSLIPYLSSTSDGHASFILPIPSSKGLLQLTELEIMYLVMFYFSDVARYTPHVWLRLHSGQDNYAVLLCQEVLRSCENKFLHLLQQRMVYAITLPLGVAALNKKPEEPQ